MASRRVPSERELFDLAVATRDSCAAVLGDTAEEAISLLAVAAFQLQAAHVGARIADMANVGEDTEGLRTIATDYGGAFSASLNLSVRCSTTVIDLCAAALGRLCGFISSPNREMDAAEVRRVLATKSAAPSLAVAADALLARMSSPEFSQLELLRHEVTHRRYRRGVYATTLSPPQPAPLAYPRQIDVQLGGEMVPLDVAARTIVDFADATFREFCANLSGTNCA